VAHVGDDDQAELREAIEALQHAEDHLAKIDRAGLLTKLIEMTELIEAIPQVQLDMRIARMRLTAKLRSDPDKTPVQHVKGQSSAMLARVEAPTGTKR